MRFFALLGRSRTQGVSLGNYGKHRPAGYEPKRSTTTSDCTDEGAIIVWTNNASWHFHMDRELTPRQLGADEMVTREWFAGCEASSPMQTFEMMTPAYQSTVLGQLSTLETQTQRCKL